MELNARQKRSKIINPEGSVVLERNPEIQLYLEATNLKIKSDSFYEKVEDTLTKFIQHAKVADEGFVLGLAKFCADNGLKLSPVVLLSVLSSRGFSFGEMNLNYIFNTPQRIAEAIALSNLLKNTLGIKLNNSFKKNILKVALENLSSFTLTKNQMKRRKIKTRDLIKLLRPKPKDSKMATLYKSIIEGTAKMEKDSFVKIKSDKNISDEDKMKYFEKNIETMPINELIRNLRFIKDNAGFTKTYNLQKKVLDKLSNIKDFRFLNVFDLIEAAIHVPELEKMLFELTQKFALKAKEEFGISESCTFLIDRSGSMDEKPIKVAFKYLVLLSQIFDSPKVRFFGDILWNSSEDSLVLKYLSKGRISEAYDIIKDCPDGTALLNSIRDLLNEDKEIKNLVVISDEVSWVEGQDLSDEIDAISKMIKDKKVILINPAVYSGTVFKDNLMAFSSITSNVVNNVSLFINPNKFIQTIKEYGKK